MLAVRDLQASYGAVVALRGISLAVQAGEMVGIIGANGAGKSTTLGCISGVVRPRGGQIELEDDSLVGLPPEAIVRRGIAMVPEGRRIFPGLTVRENLVLGAVIRRDRDAVEEDLRRWCGFFPILGERLDLPAGNLSGGEQQQLAIARALMSRPRLLMLDEPSLGLAPRLVDDMFRLIDDLRRTGVTILLVEQVVSRTLELVDRVYLLKTGTVEFAGSPEQLRQQADVESAYLGLQQ